MRHTFTVDTLNQLTSVAPEGTITVAGTSSATASSVTVNTFSASLYADKTFAKDGFSLTSSNFTAIAIDSLGRSDTNNVTVPPSVSQSFTYDQNGNLLSDGRRGFDYDDENQLIRITSTNAWKSEFIFDGLQRRAKMAGRSSEVIGKAEQHALPRLRVA